MSEDELVQNGPNEPEGEKTKGVNTYPNREPNQDVYDPDDCGGPPTITSR